MGQSGVTDRERRLADALAAIEREASGSTTESERAKDGRLLRIVLTARKALNG